MPYFFGNLVSKIDQLTRKVNCLLHAGNDQISSINTCFCCIWLNCHSWDNVCLLSFAVASKLYDPRHTGYIECEEVSVNSLFCLRFHYYYFSLRCFIMQSLYILEYQYSVLLESVFNVWFLLVKMESFNLTTKVYVWNKKQPQISEEKQSLPSTTTIYDFWCNVFRVENW